MKHTKLILTLLCLVLFSGMAQAQGNDASTPITQAGLGGRKALVEVSKYWRMNHITSLSNEMD